MANPNESVVNLILRGEDQVSQAVKSALSSVGDFSSGISNLASPLADFGTNALKLETGVLAIGAAATSMAIVLAGDFDKAFREIATIIGIPSAELGEFRQEILDFARNSTQDLSDITAAYYSALSASVAQDDVTQFLEKAEQLAVAGVATIAQSVDVVTSLLNAYGLGVEEATRVSDVLFATVRQGKTTLSELAGAMAGVTGNASLLEVPIETVAAFLATLTGSGTSTSEAVTQLNAALAALIAPSQGAKDVAEKLGIEFNAAAVRTQGFEGVLQSLGNATEEEIAKLFGSQEALKVVLAATGQQAESLARNLEITRNSAEFVTAAFEDMVQALDLDIIRRQAQIAFIEFGDPLLKAAGGISGALADVFKSIGFSFRDGNLRQITDFVKGEMEKLETIFKAAAKAFPEALQNADLSGFTDGLEIIRDAVASLFDGFDLTSAEGMQKFIEAIGQGFTILSKFSAGVLSSFQWLFDGMSQLDGGEWLDFAESIATTAGEISGMAIQIRTLADGVSSFTGFLESVGNVFTVIGAAAAALALKIALVSGASATAAATAAAVAGKIALAVAPLTVAAAGGFAVGTFIADGVDSLVNAVTDAESSLGTAIFDFFNSQDLEPLADLTISIDELTATNEGAVDSLNNLSDAATETDPALQGLADSAEGAYQEIETWEEAAGIIRDMGGTIEEAAESTEFASNTMADFTMEMKDGIPTYTAVGKAIKETGDEAEDATEKSEKFQIEMEKLASNERIKNIEARISLDIAQLEADTKRVEAAFDSINATVSSTGDVIGDSLSGLGAFADMDMFDILNNPAFRLLEEQLKIENQRRQEAMDLQKLLTLEEIETMKARRKAMERGEGMIQIDGAGLQPHLEAFMWEILTAIQIRVNQDGLELLLGQ